MTQFRRRRNRRSDRIGQVPVTFGRVGLDLREDAISVFLEARKSHSFRRIQAGDETVAGRLQREDVVVIAELFDGSLATGAFGIGATEIAAEFPSAGCALVRCRRLTQQGVEAVRAGP